MSHAGLAVNNLARSALAPEAGCFEDRTHLRHHSYSRTSAAEITLSLPPTIYCTCENSNIGRCLRNLPRRRNDVRPFKCSDQRRMRAFDPTTQGTTYS